MTRFQALKYSAAGALLAVGTAANAAVDVTALTAVLPDIVTVGAACFAVAVGIKLTKWVRRVL